MELEKESRPFYNEEVEESDEDCPELVPAVMSSKSDRCAKVPGKSLNLLASYAVI